MTIERVYAPGWGVGEKLTSAQQNAIDLNTTYALDRRAGKGDVLMSVVVATGTGRIIASVATGPDADKTFHAEGGNSIVRIPTLTAARAYTLGHSGATGGDRIFFYYEGTGGTPSGYVDIKNNVGTGLFRLGQSVGQNPSFWAEGDAAEFSFVGSGWQLMQGAGPGLRVIEFLTSTTWTCPPGVHQILVHGWGGGGGGGAGGDGNVISQLPVGGGGGGGAQDRVVGLRVMPGAVYTVEIGNGGTSPAFSVGGGSRGQDTKFLYGATALAQFNGAEGGGISTAATATLVHHIARGGANVRLPFTVLGGAVVASGSQNFTSWFGPGWGGNGNGKHTPTGIAMNYGMASVQGFGGGAPGIVGTTPSGTSAFGGGAGGGGGGGPLGAGAAGGNGGDGGTNGVNGTAPADAAPNSGAGGGGGGAGGNAIGVGVPGTGSVGSSGGSGKLSLWMIK